MIGLDAIHLFIEISDSGDRFPTLMKRDCQTLEEMPAHRLMKVCHQAKLAFCLRN